MQGQMCQLMLVGIKIRFIDKQFDKKINKKLLQQEHKNCNKWANESSQLTIKHMTQFQIQGESSVHRRDIFYVLGKR